MHVTNLISLACGSAAHIRLPRALALLAVRAFARHYRIDPAECAKELSAYRSVGEFFARELREDARPLGEGVTSPVDGVLRGWGKLDEGVITQVKGCTYEVAELLGDAARAGEFDGGSYLHFYLSPRDYHHVHAPLGGRLIDCRRLRGSLWPVNDWCLQRVKRLFARNARAVLYMQTPAGLMAVVMVGALNVGSIELRHERAQGAAGGAEIARGAPLGSFRLGSSVVVLFQAGAFVPASIPAGSAVRCRQSVGQWREAVRATP